MKKTSSELILELLGSTSAFPVEFERYWRLTGCRKETLKKDLTTSFKAGVDYCICLQSLPGSKQQTARLSLSLDCFKSLLRRTAKGQRICQLFEQYEKVIYQTSLRSDAKSKDVRKAQQIKWQLLHKLCQEWSEPLNKINLAVQMMQVSDTRHQQYLQILQEEVLREKKLLEQVAKLLEMTSDENLQLLHQFNLLGQQH